MTSEKNSEIKENLICQMLEFETLQSVYPKELLISDHGNMVDINKFINGETDEIPHHLEYIIELTFSLGVIKVSINLPLEYPQEYPEIYCRSENLERTEQKHLNKCLFSFMESQEKGEPVIYSLISWVQDNAELYLENSITIRKNKECSKVNNTKLSEEFSRYWIYSHHIYCKYKRKEIIDIAKNNNLTGFSLVGKPGIICIEGSINDCEYFWQQLKSMTWQRINIKFIEKDFQTLDNINGSRKFSCFQEMSFPSTERHNDMASLIKYLTKHELQYAFKEIFGIEAKISQDSD